MKKCYKCNIEINSEDNYCPLCNSRIEDDVVDPVFPNIPTIYQKHGLFRNVLGFLSIFGSLVSITLNVLINKSISWSWFVIFGIATFWITVSISIKRRKHYMKKLYSEFNAIMLIAILWDYFTKWNGWSLNYCLPFICISYIITMFVMRIFFKEHIKEYIFYLYLNCLVGLSPMLLIPFGLINVLWPSILSVITSLFTLSFLYIFNYNSLHKETSRRFHI